MVMSDHNLRLAVDDDIDLLSTGSTTSSNHVVLSPALTELREIGMGEQLVVDCHVTEGFNSGGAAKLTVYAVLSPTAPPSLGATVGNQRYIGCQGPFESADLAGPTTGVGTESGTRFAIALSPMMPKTVLADSAGYPFLHLVYLVETTTFTAGKISAAITTASRSQALHYPATTGGLTAWAP